MLKPAQAIPAAKKKAARNAGRLWFETNCFIN